MEHEEERARLAVSLDEGAYAVFELMLVHVSALSEVVVLKESLELEVVIYPLLDDTAS